MIAAGLILSYLLLKHERMNTLVNQDSSELVDMSMVGSVTIILPTLNEEDSVEQSLFDLEDQNVRLAYPEFFEVIVADSESVDRTVQLASNFDVSVFNVVRGKLNAIDAVMRHARGDIIVAVDADSRYAPNFLNLMLNHFVDSEVVGVSGSGLYDGYPLVSVLRESIASMLPRMTGRGSAYRKDAYFSVGGFDLSIDQTDSFAMVNEEEFGLWSRLSQIGKVVNEDRASVLTSARRIDCMLGAKNDYCQSLGKDRF